MTLLALLTALWLGVLTSVSPCPLATNVLAVSYIARQGRGRARTLIAAVAYTLGRTVTYVALGALGVWGLLNLPGLSQFLQRFMNELLGPVLILVGMVLTGLLTSRRSISISARASQKAAAGGSLGAAALGAIFALSFCPVSAALFFGGLLPVAVQARSSFLLPSLYGVGTALPVIFLGSLLAVSSSLVGRWFARIESVEKWTRLVTGAAFIAIGIYFCLRHVFGVI